jgi:hypothetical protein
MALLGELVGVVQSATIDRSDCFSVVPCESGLGEDNYSLLRANINLADLDDLGEPPGLEVKVEAVEVEEVAPFRSFSLALATAALTPSLPFSRASSTFFLISALGFHPGFRIASIR